MVKCLQCGVECDPAEATDGRCHLCGAVLPDSSGKPTTTTQATSTGPPPVPSNADEEEQENVDDLIKPRELSGEYARHVTASWLSTPSLFTSHEETIDVEPSPHENEARLVIGPRSVGEVDDKDRADYELMEIIGEGNMGKVYAARQSAIDRVVAVKFPKPLDGGQMTRDQFISEVVVSGQLEHPNIVPIYDLAKDVNGQLFYSMKKVEGQPWNECIADKTLDENVEILMKVCDAIRFSHARGIIHRDIKPHNIMVGQYGEVSLMDFGIAIRIDEEEKDSRITKVSPAGTPAYMAPEMVSGKIVELKPATDVYLLGAVLFEIVTGHPPHPPRTTLEEVVLAAARNEIVTTDKGGELIDVAKKAMATDSNMRFQSVDEFQAAIRAYWSHAESIALVERGEEHLAEAMDVQQSNAQRFDSYDRARFAFQEAIDLWDQNQQAKDGLSRTSLAYAQFALETKNYARGIDLLDKNNPSHRDLLNRLLAARRRQDEKDRMRRFLIGAVAVAVAIIAVGGSTASVIIYRAWNETDKQKNLVEQERDRAVVAEADATDQKNKAIQARQDADEQKEQAIKARNTADEQRTIAVNAKKVADEQKKAAVEAKEEATEQRGFALESSYVFEIGLVDETIQRNSFERAIEILEEHIEEPIQKASRGWEWGRLKYLATKPVARFSDGRKLTHRVESSAISRDTGRIVAGTHNGLLYVWEHDDNQKPARLSHGSNVRSVAISNDGRYIASAGDAADPGEADDPNEGQDADYAVKIWTTPVRQGAAASSILRGHEGPVLSVALANIDGELYVLTGGADGTARLWRRSDSSEAQVFYGHAGAVWSARFSADGRRIVTAGEDGTVRVWSTQTRQEVVSPRFAHAEPVYAAEFSPDGKFIVSGGRDRRLLVWNVPATAVKFDERQEELQKQLSKKPSPIVTGTKALGQHNATVRSISFSEDGQIVVSAGHDNAVRIWDFSKRFTNAAQLKELRGHSNWVRSCSVYNEGDAQWVLSSGYDSEVKLWDWKRYEMAQVLREDPEEGLSDDNIVSATYSRDGRWVVTASEGGVVAVWDLQDPKNPRRQLLEEGHAGLSTTGILFAGTRLMTAAGDNTTRIWDRATGRELFQLGSGSYKPEGTGWRGVAAVSHDGRWIATGSDTVLAEIWDARTGVRLAQSMSVNDQRFVSVEGKVSPPIAATAIAFSIDDKMIFVGDENGFGHLLDRSGKKRLDSFAAHGDRITAAKYLPDGDLITAGADGIVAKWSLTSGRPTRAFALEHKDRVLAMDVSDDGRWILTSSGAQTDRAMVHLWDVENRKEWKRLSLREELATAESAPDSGAETPNSPRRFPVIRSVDIHASGEHALITVFNPVDSKHRIGRWNWNNNKQVYQDLGVMPDVSMAKYIGRDDEILTVGGRGARLWDNELKQVKMSFRQQRFVNSASFSHDGQFIVCAGADGAITGTAKVWQFNPQSQKWESAAKLISDSPSLNSAVFHPQSSDVILTASDGGQDGEAGKVEIWQRQPDGTWEAMTLGGSTRGAVHQAIFSPDGTRVLAMSEDGLARIWNYDLDQGTARPLGQSLQHKTSALCGTFSRNGQWIAVGCGDGKTSIWKADWNAGSIELVDTTERHTQEITAVAFSLEDEVPRRLLTASRDFTVRLWDTVDLEDPEKLSPNQLLTLEEHSGEVMSVEFSPHDNGLHVLTAGKDGRVIIRPSVPLENGDDAGEGLVGTSGTAPIRAHTSQ